MLDNGMRKIRIIGMLLVLALLGACANNVVVVGNIPSPLIQRLPLSAHVNYSEELRNFTYTENEKVRSSNLNSLNFGEAQITMFEQVFAQVFTMVNVNESASDISISPQILDFQYSAPAENQLNLYEVWLKYRIQVLDSQDQSLADWVVKGYGKTPAGGTFASAAKAFSAATNVALRDVGAQLSIGFEKQPSIQELISNGKRLPLGSVLGGQVIESDQQAQELEPSTGESK